MPYIRVWVHIVWSTKNRTPLLVPEIRENIFAHMKIHAEQKGILLSMLNGWQDHVHALVLLKADQSIAKVVQLLKGESSHWLNEQKPLSCVFEWQDDYYAVSVSESGIEKVKQYIIHQEEHHRIKSFPEECDEFFKNSQSRNKG